MIRTIATSARALMVPLFLMMTVSGIAQTAKTTPEGVIHLETPDRSIVSRSVTLEILQNLITDAEKSTRLRAAKWKAENLGKGSFVSDRIILSDSCMGSDQYEHDQLGEGSIICLLGISKDPSELPFAKVYFEGKDGLTPEILDQIKRLTKP